MGLQPSLDLLPHGRLLRQVVTGGLERSEPLLPARLVVHQARATSPRSRRELALDCVNWKRKCAEIDKKLAPGKATDWRIRTGVIRVIAEVGWQEREGSNERTTALARPGHEVLESSVGRAVARLLTPGGVQREEDAPNRVKSDIFRRSYSRRADHQERASDATIGTCNLHFVVADRRLKAKRELDLYAADSRIGHRGSCYRLYIAEVLRRDNEVLHVVVLTADKKFKAAMRLCWEQ